MSFPLQQPHRDAIDSVVKTVNATYFGVAVYPTPEDRAAAYFCHIIKRHPVTDGNKRLAVLWLDFYCNALELKLDPSISLDRLAVAVEKSNKSLAMRDLIAVVKTALF